MGAGPESPGLASAYDAQAAVAAVEAAAAMADHVVVTIHWGRELEACPADHQYELATALAAAGADVIAGHHAHRLQGLEQRDGTVIAYGLGNRLLPPQEAAQIREQVTALAPGAGTCPPRTP